MINATRVEIACLTAKRERADGRAGVDITGDLVREAGEGIVQTVQAVGGLLGTIMTIYGRVRATRPLEQRNLQLKL